MSTIAPYAQYGRQLSWEGACAMRRTSLCGNTAARAGRHHDTRTQGDAVCLSEQAQCRKSERLPDDPQTFWQRVFGMSGDADGTTSGGLRREFTVEGDTAELLEYEGDRLVRRIQGTRNGEFAVLDTEQYDAAGALNQTVHATVQGLGGDSVSVDRRVAWFESGVLTLELEDSMTLGRSLGDNGDDESPLVAQALTQGSTAGQTDGQVLLDATAQEFTRQNYSGVVRQYSGGILAREAAFNRSLGDVAADGTVIEHLYDQGTPQYAVRDYDQEGNLLRDARFSGSPLAGTGWSQQTVSVAWFEDGQLTARKGGQLRIRDEEGAQGAMARHLASAGSGQSKESVTGSLMSLLAYPDTAGAAGTPGSLPEAGMTGMGQAQTMVQALAEQQTGDAQYQLDWQSELYRDGTMVLRTRDTMQSRANPMYREPREDVAVRDNESARANLPKTLQSSRHTVEQYSTSGKLQQRSEQKFRETVRPPVHDRHNAHDKHDKRNDYTVSTIAEETSWRGVSDWDRAWILTHQPIEDVDARMGEAAISMGTELGMLLSDLQNLLDDMQGDDANLMASASDAAAEGAQSGAQQGGSAGGVTDVAA